ncbi:MAG TPA: 16S rRNA processing protein RimM, partial [bacterium]|nr:16S rRNA processing protein RimM [bacterium]
MRDKINENELIRIGIIIKPHGLKGELKVQPLTSNIKRFELLESVNLAGGDYAIERIKYQNKYVILKFRGIDNIETAEKFRNVY